MVNLNFGMKILLENQFKNVRIIAITKYKLLIFLMKISKKIDIKKAKHRCLNGFTIV